MKVSTIIPILIFASASLLLGKTEFSGVWKLDTNATNRINGSNEPELEEDEVKEILLTLEFPEPDLVTIDNYHILGGLTDKRFSTSKIEWIEEKKFSLGLPSSEDDSTLTVTFELRENGRLALVIPLSGDIGDFVMLFNKH